MVALESLVMDTAEVELTAHTPEPRRIRDEGTPEAVWQTWPGLDAIESVPIEKWIHPAMRLVVVAPHPDDEILACGGLMAMHAARGGSTLVVAVTDGEASHAEVPSWRADRLAAVRRAERAQGLSRLGCASTDVHRLGLADGKVASQTTALEEELKRVVRWGDIVVTTWRRDGHPDHEACGEAAAGACRAAHCCLLQAPVWMWHWSTPGDPQVPWHRLVGLGLTSREVAGKQRALAAHASQLQPRSSAVGPVLGPTMLERLGRRSEYFFA